MPRQRPDDQIEMLRRQQAEIAARLKEAETRARQKKRLDAQRREMLAGRCMIHQLEQHPGSALTASLLQLLGGFLTRPTDRALFIGLKAGGIAAAAHTEEVEEVAERVDVHL